MSMATRVAPIAAAGVVGILVGYLLAPNVSAVREDFAARFNEQTPLVQQLQASVAAIETRLGAMPDGASLNATITEQLTAAEGRLATQTEALGAQLGEQSGTVPEELRTGIEETRTAITDLQSQIETLGTDIAAMREESAASAASAPPEDEAGALANEVGAAGAVLLAGQAAIFGGTRVDLVALDVENGTARLTPEGGEESEIAAGETLEVSPTCTVRLAGVASNAAYLAPEECSEGEPAPAEQAAPAAPTPDAAPAPDAEPAAADTQNQPPAGEAPAGDQQEGTDVPVQGTQAVPDQQPGQAEENAPNAGEPQGGQPQPAQ